MSRIMTKPTKWVCAQRRLRSAWASAQSDQSLRCALSGYLRAQAFFMRTAKTLIRLGGCPGWSESSLGAHSLCWFCHVAAQNSEMAVNSVIVSWKRIHVAQDANQTVPIIIRLMKHSNQKGNTFPQGESHTGSPGLLAFHRAKSVGLLFSPSLSSEILSSPVMFWASSWENLFMPYANNKGTD